MQAPSDTEVQSGVSLSRADTELGVDARASRGTREPAVAALVDHGLVAAKPFRRAIADLVPDLRRRAGEADRERRVPAENMASLRELGFFRAFVPRVYGGDERTLADVLECATELAIGCPSTAWVATLFAMHTVAACWLERRGQDEIFADGPDALVASSVAPVGTIVPAPGGFRLTGRWGFSSGVEHAAWIMVGANLQAESPSVPPEYVFAFVRAAEATVVDDWHVAGLRGTGSKSIALDDVFVPHHRAVLVSRAHDGTAPGFAIHSQPFYRLPWYPVFICAFPAVGLGTALAMLEDFRTHIRSRVDGFSGLPFASNAGSALRMAAAAAEIDAARLVFRRDVAALDRAAREARALAPGEAERIMYDAPFVMDACSRAALEILRGSGGKAVYETSPLQRHFRDIHAMTQHVAMDLDRAGETYGRALFQNAELPLGARERARDD